MIPSIEYHIKKRPLNNSIFCGDTAVFKQDGALAGFGVADVLGHGREANELAEQITAYLTAADFSQPEILMKEIHQHILGSRGAVIGLGSLNIDTGRLEYVIMGNITFRLFGPYDIRIVPKEGIVGYKIRKPGRQKLDLDEDTTILIYTDGVSDHFNRTDYPGIITDDATVTASTVIERYAKEYDDALCMVIKYYGNR